MANKSGHRRFGNVRRRESGRYQIRYQGPDGRMRSHPETFARKSDADRLLSLIEAQVTRGEWTDPDRARVKLGHYAETWIAQRPGLRPRTRDLYQWLLIRHITPYLGGLPLGTIETQTLREWRARLLDQGISVTMAAKAYRLLRAILTTAVAEDKILARNPCRIRGAGSELAAERPVLTVAQVFDRAEHVGRRPIGNVRKLRTGGYRLRCQQAGVMVTVPTIFASRPAADEALWTMADHGQADWKQDQCYRALILLATFASLRWGEATALRRCDVDLATGTVLVRHP
jgi:integrase